MSFETAAMSLSEKDLIWLRRLELLGSRLRAKQMPFWELYKLFFFNELKMRAKAHVSEEISISQKFAGLPVKKHS
jgi:hypothetical protein